MGVTDHCGRCGYLKEFHDLARRCPGMKTGTWKERDPIDGALWPEILARDVAAQMRAIEQARKPYLPPPIDPPVVLARPPRGKEEFAQYGGRQALGIGRMAVSAGMDVAPYYWKSGVGTEGCAVKGYRPSLAFVATWERKAGAKGWGFDIAYAWDPSDRTMGPTKLRGVGQLEELLRGH